PDQDLRDPEDLDQVSLGDDEPVGESPSQSGHSQSSFAASVAACSAPCPVLDRNTSSRLARRSATSSTPTPLRWRSTSTRVDLPPVTGARIVRVCGWVVTSPSAV